MQLFPQAVQSQAGRDKASLADPRAPTGRSPALIQTVQGFAADLATWGDGVGFGLSAPFDGLARPFLHLVLGLPFQMTQIVISGQDKLVQRSFQGAGG
ncbi:MAG TPA: hypothetical protein VI136_06105, partial [Verrucomicrobiae bacterium]